jgi:hypothetical protein
VRAASKIQKAGSKNFDKVSYIINKRARLHHQ